MVIHSAATLKLEAKLKDAVEMNVVGTYRVLELAKQIKNLKVRVQSTCIVLSFKLFTKVL